MTSGREWPRDLLDVDAMQASGFRPRPFREFVLKIHQRCNLACDYCYVYTMSDQTWRTRPAAMSAAVWRVAIKRIAEHAETHQLGNVSVILHGGEPLLFGQDRLVALVTDLRRALADTCAVTIGLQTNGVLLDEAWMDTLARHAIRVGISMDGSAVAHDRHRRTHGGRGSHAAAARALRLLTAPGHREIFAGLLCTIDPRSDPLVCYQALVEYAPPMIDFLLPHANWSSPPSRPVDGGPTPYGDWLIAVFDRWYGANEPETRIRLFDEAISLLLGGSSRSEQVGLGPVVTAVVESDGAIEQIDSLKSAYAGAAETGLTVFADRFDSALTHPGVVARQMGVLALGDTCRACDVHRVCGAGHYAHRYRPGSGFRNPSVYCVDLRRLIQHVYSRVASDLSVRVEGTLR